MSMIALSRTAIVNSSSSCFRRTKIHKLHTNHNGTRPINNASLSSTPSSSTNISKATTTVEKSVSKTSSQNVLSRIFDHQNTFMNKPRSLIGNMSWSQSAGHASFVLAVSAYLTTDILDLRCMVIGATSLGMVFQYYTPISKPLRIPLYWNGLLLCINAFMASSLYYERHQAERMSPSMVQLYQDGMFGKRGFSRVEFCKLFQIAKQRHVTKGNVLIAEGKPNSKMFLLVDGKLVIECGGKQITSVSPHKFIGEMSFLEFLLNKEERKEGAVDNVCCYDNGDEYEYKYDDENESYQAYYRKESKQHDGKKGKEASLYSLATAHVVVASQNALVYEWDFDKMCRHLEHHHEVANALQAYISHDLRLKLEESNIKLLTS